MARETPLSKGFGYGIVLGLGAAFAFGMILTTWMLKRYIISYELEAVADPRRIKRAHCMGGIANIFD